MKINKDCVGGNRIVSIWTYSIYTIHEFVKCFCHLMRHLNVTVVWIHWFNHAEASMFCSKTMVNGTHLRSTWNYRFLCAFFVNNNGIKAKENSCNCRLNESLVYSLVSKFACQGTILLFKTTCEITNCISHLVFIFVFRFYL